MSPQTRLGRALWRVKTRLQFTGWLQYLLNLVAALAWLGIAGLGRLIEWLIGWEAGLLVWPPLAVAGLLCAAFIFDVCTLKLGLRPAEAIPPAQNELDVFDLMRARRSCRSFQTRELTPAHRDALFESARIHTAPSRLSGDRPIRLEYIAAPLTVWPVLGAHEFFVAIAPREYDRLAVIDVGRSLQRVVLEATRLGVATCWIGPGADHESILRHLGERFDPERDHVICVCALGYRSRLLPLMLRLVLQSQRRRLPSSALFFADPELEVPLDTQAQPFARFGRCYEVCQWSPSSFNGQPTRCAAILQGVGEGGEPELVRFDFLASTASRFYAPVALGIWCANWETGCAALGIEGRFCVLTPAQRGQAPTPEPPRYDLSWVLDSPLTQGPAPQ